MDVEKPDDLGADGSAFWDRVTEERSDLKRSDFSALKLACKWLDKAIEKLREPKAEIAAGIATDKFLIFSSRFGLTPADRKALGIAEKKREEGRRKTSLSDLTPEKLGVERKVKEKPF